MAFDLDCPQQRQTERDRLKELLSKVIGADKFDIGDDHLDVLISIGQGMFWTKELDVAARELAAKVEAELSLYRSENL
jgi:hypothetical protein